ncbi:hypothetical protein ABGB12_25955 [Actinocorallia sp. B10E7]|uniref:hypothetical protein n=1 Tax=Actinocorallia sp. B10E7 TaxID=3153558 RepID=UPI00325F5474
MIFGLFCSVPAWAEPGPSRADLLAQRLEKDPVQVTDHEPRAIPEGAAERIEKTLEALGEPFFVVVETSEVSTRAGREQPGELISLLHDRMRKDGIYLVTNSRGNGTARQYGGARPVERAWSTAQSELPYDAGVTRHVERFVEILRAPDVNARIEARREAPESEYRSRSEERDRTEMTALGIGAALSGLPLIALLVFNVLRKGKRK